MRPTLSALLLPASLLLSCGPSGATQDEPVDCQVMVSVDGFAVLDLSAGDGTGTWSGHEDDTGSYQAPELDGFEHGYTERWDVEGAVTSPSEGLETATRFTVELVATLPDGARSADQMPDPVALTYVFDREQLTLTLERTHQGECAGTWEHTMDVTALSITDTRTGPILTLEYAETWYDWCGEGSCPTETGAEPGAETGGGTDLGTDVGGGGPDNGYSPYGAPAGPPDLGTVTWLHTNVSGWDDSAVLSSVSVGSDQICLDYDKADVWPSYDYDGDGTLVVGNPWIFIWEGDRWYAATWEWLRPGQTCKAEYAVAGDHIKQSPFHASSGWEPVSGVTYYFMVSGLARGGERNVEQRTNLVPYTWP